MVIAILAALLFPVFGLTRRSWKSLAAAALLVAIGAAGGGVPWQQQRQKRLDTAFARALDRYEGSRVGALVHHEAGVRE